MKRALPLPKASARDDADAGSVQETQAVVLIRLLACLLGRFHSLGWQGDGREEVHRALR